MTGKMFSFAATETGYNHIKAEPSKVCEDASGFYDDDQMHICVVADGHGSDNYPRTDRGARFAVNAAIEQIKAFVGEIYDPNPENPEISEKESSELIDKLLHTKINETHLLQYLSRNILMKWREFVEKDVEENPFQEIEMVNVSEKYKKRYMPEDIRERRPEKAYGCTLIAYVVTEKFSFGMQIGDGKCVVIDRKGTIAEPIPWDDNCQMNVTTSICDSDASDEFRFCVTNETPSAVFCSSDGIDDSYASVEEMYALYRSILKIFSEYGEEVGKSEIKEYLPTLTKKGSGDDVSIALIMDIQRVKELTPVFAAQTELFDLENQLKEKQHAAKVNEEKEKALTSKFSVLIRQGSRDLLDQNLCNQINELRTQMVQKDEEIEDLKEKIQNLKLTMSDIVVQSVPCIEEATENVEDTSDKNMVEYSETQETAAENAENSVQEAGAGGIETLNVKAAEQETLSEQTEVVEAVPDEVVEEKKLESQKGGISRKKVTKEKVSKVEEQVELEKKTGRRKKAATEEHEEKQN